MGLENIRALSSQGQHVLQVELSDCAGQRRLEARYRFRLDGEEEKFALHLEQEASPGAEETMATPEESGLPFSTADRDNDLASDVNCAALLSGTTDPPTPHTRTGRLIGFYRTKTNKQMKPKNALLFVSLQVVGGSVTAGGPTSMGDIPEGSASTGGGSSPEDKRCSGRPQGDRTPL